MKHRIDRLDLIVLACLCLFATIFAIRFVDFTLPPFEDAAMLMRYAENFALGHGIVWNIGEAPVDGATDFLFMLVLGLIVKAGLSLEFATRVIGFSSHILTIWIVYLSLRQIFNTPRPFAVIPALYLSVGPGFFYVAEYFGTPFFALFASIAWYFALLLIQNGEDDKSSLLFAVMALITALIRPEGVILTGLMLLSIIYIKGLKSTQRTVYYFFAIFLSIGGIYLLWRWNYFGYFLPNPFYKKGGFKIYPLSLQISLLNTLFFCLPFVPAFIVGLCFKKTRRLTIGVLIPLIGFASAFILLSNEMNFGARFQYALLPMALMTWWPLLIGLLDYLKISEWNSLDLQKRVKILLPVILLAIGAIGYLQGIGRVENYRDIQYDISIMLSNYKDKGFTLATTEAGLLPLYSHWRSLDLWGLNDKWIAHNGKISEEYLKNFNPHVIMVHVVIPSPDSSSETKTGQWYEKFVMLDTRDKDWYEMAMTAKSYAEKNGYNLAIALGPNSNDIRYYYVRPDFPESVEIINRIRTIERDWNKSGVDKNNVSP